MKTCPAAVQSLQWWRRWRGSSWWKWWGLRWGQVCLRFVWWRGGRWFVVRCHDWEKAEWGFRICGANWVGSWLSATAWASSCPFATAGFGASAHQPIFLARLTDWSSAEVRESQPNTPCCTSASSWYPEGAQPGWQDHHSLGGRWAFYCQLCFWGSCTCSSDCALESQDSGIGSHEREAGGGWVLQCVGGPGFQISYTRGSYIISYIKSYNWKCCIYASMLCLRFRLVHLCASNL